MGWTQGWKGRALLAADLCLLVGTKGLAVLLGHGFHAPAGVLWGIASWAWVDLAVVAILFPLFGLYRRVWRCASISDLVALACAVAARTVLTAGVLLLVPLGPVPPGILFIEAALALLALGGLRLGARCLVELRRRRVQRQHKPVLIVGAGDAGLRILRELRDDPSLRLRPIGIVDDDREKHGWILQGIRVVGGREVIPRVVRAHGVREVFVAIPSAPQAQIAGILRFCSGLPVRCRVAPPLAALVGGLRMTDMEETDAECLLDRPSPPPVPRGFANAYRGLSVLVTGAGGSNGSELTMQLARQEPRLLVLYERSENELFRLEQDLRRTHPGVVVQPVLGDIVDRAQLRETFELYGPEIVFHAAAHKHVPLMEGNPLAAALNNVVGTWEVARAAGRARCGRFVFISTDKAVRPRNVMGATKAFAELIVRSLQGGRTDFRAVRFGNVLGSRGSVVGTFLRQIRSGGPVTVTHADMERYLMSIEEAVRLVLAVGALPGEGGIHDLEMGAQVKIVELARRMIRMAGYDETEIPIVYTGLRPGEKLQEELRGAGETSRPTPIAGVRRVDAPPVSALEVARTLRRLRRAIRRRDAVGVLRILAGRVHGYQPAPEGAGRLLAQDARVPARSERKVACRMVAS